MLRCRLLFFNRVFTRAGCCKQTKTKKPRFFRADTNTSNEFASSQAQRSLSLPSLLPRQQRGDPFVRLQLPCAQEARL